MTRRIEPGNVVMFFAGLLFIAGGFYVWTYLGRFIENAQEISATVVDLVYESATKKGRIHPVVRFRTRDGREVVATSYQHRNVRPGETLQVLYDPAKPAEIGLGTIENVRHRRILISVLAVVIGLTVCTLSAALDPNTLKWRFKNKQR